MLDAIDKDLLKAVADLEDIPKKVQKEIAFHLAEKMIDVVKTALEPKS